MSVEILVGRTLTSYQISEDRDELVLFDTENKKYVMHHHQDCCERVYLEDVNGDLENLIGTPIVNAYEESTTDLQPGQKVPEEYDDGVTWTFYRISTSKGTVVLRWYGSSNGYYSESVDFHEVGTSDLHCY